MELSFKKISAKLFTKRHAASVVNTWPKVERDWNILLLSFFFIFFVIVILNGILFSRISRGEIFLAQKESGDQTLTVDRGLLKKTLDFY